jgi:hypothetical protein
MAYEYFTPEEIARHFREESLRLAPEGIRQNPWESMSEGGRSYLVSVIATLIEQGVILPGVAHTLELDQNATDPRATEPGGR